MFFSSCCVEKTIQKNRKYFWMSCPKTLWSEKSMHNWLWFKIGKIKAKDIYQLVQSQSLILIMGMEGRVAETCSRTACSGCYDREGPQMSGHHKPLLSRQPCRTDHLLLFIPHSRLGTFKVREDVTWGSTLEPKILDLQDNWKQHYPFIGVPWQKSSSSNLLPISFPPLSLTPIFG